MIIDCRPKGARSQVVTARTENAVLPRAAPSVHRIPGMRSVQLRTEGSVGLLLADLVVLWFAIGGVVDTDAPTWLRVTCGAVAALAASLTVRSLALLRRARSAKRT